MKLITLLFSLLVSAVTTAQTVINDKNAETRSLHGFHSIKVSSGIDLYLSPGAEAVAVSASDIKHRDKIKTTVENGVLKIWYDYDGGNGSWTVNKNLKAYVSFKELKMLSGSGGSDIRVDGTIKTADFSLNISGGSDFNGRVEAADMKVDQSGGADINISGKANKINIDASGGSDFDGDNFVVDYCTVEASGGSDVNITVNKEMSAHASGASDIVFRGSGTLKESKSSGASSVKKRG